MRYLSVCSGIEAATVAWHPLGWTPVAFSEIEAFPSAVLKHHYPSVPNWGDMTRCHEWPDATVDLLVGGTPCQSFSVAGLRTGLADPRGNLALTYLAILDRYRPTWCCWENVPGVLSSGGGRDVGAFLGGLGELGYGWAYRVLDAQYFGVAQRRRRVFVVGHLGSWQRAAAVLFDAASLSGHPAPRREAGAGIAEGAVSRALSRVGGGDDPGANKGAPVVIVPEIVPQAMSAKWAKGTSGPAEDEVANLVAHALRADGFDASEDGTGRGTPLVPVQAFDARQSDVIQYGDKTGPLDTDGHSVAVATYFQDDMTLKHNPHTTWALRREAGGQGACVASNMAVRRLTPVECARLQGFPDDYLDIPYRGKPAADGPKYKALGNSMAVPVMRWIGERIQRVEALV